MLVRVALGVPEHFVPKALYAIRVLLAPFGLKAELVDIDDVFANGGIYYGSFPYPDLTGNGKVIAIESLPETWDYFERRDLYDPLQVKYIEIDGSNSVPVLFGSADTVDTTGNAIRVYFDLVASAFYWLSDWQDVTRPERDSHDRQPFHGSLQQHLKLHTRTVVDEYGEILSSLAGEIAQFQPMAACKMVLSHDIDRIRKKTAGIAVRETLDYLLLNRRSERIGQRLKRWATSMRQLVGDQDAYETSIMRLLDEHHDRDNTSCFLFKSVIERHLHDANDYLSQPFFETMLGRVKGESHEMGYHSGYEAGGNPDQLRAEYGRLCNRVGKSIKVHRSHYLRYKEGVTFVELEKLGVLIDSSMAWAEQTGFRAQTCHPYPLFDIASNRMLNIIEVPLAVMDTQPFGYMKLSAEGAIQDATEILATVRRYNGVMVWNFHHHIFDSLDAPNWNELLLAAFDMSKSSQVVTFESIYDSTKSLYE